MKTANFVKLHIDSNIKQDEKEASVTVNVAHIKLFKENPQGGTTVELSDGKIFHITRTVPYFVQDIRDSQSE